MDDLRNRLHRDRESFLRQRLDEMRDLLPEERERIVRLSADLLDHLLDRPSEKLRNGRAMRGRLGAVEALRHIFGLEETGEEKQGKRDEDAE